MTTKAEAAHVTGPTEPEGKKVADGERREESLELSVVLPAHNEVGLLGATVTSLVAGLDDRAVSYEIVVVENGSTDGTLRLARLLAAQLASVKVLSLPNGDYGAALSAGFRAARGQVIASFDVDYYDLGFLDVALELVRSKGSQLVLASKRVTGSADRRPLRRRLLTAGFTQVLRLTLALEVSDAHGMKVVSRALDPVIEQCSMRGSLFDVEMVLRAERASLEIVEVPATVIERRTPRSPVAKRAIESAIGIIRLRRLLKMEAGAEVGARGDGGRNRPTATSRRRSRREEQGSA